MRKHFKRIAQVSGLILTAAVITLAFIPHYICACGEIVKEDGSLLVFVVQGIIELVTDIIKAIVF